MDLRRRFAVKEGLDYPVSISCKITVMEAPESNNNRDGDTSCDN